MSALAGIYYLDNRTVDSVDLSRMIDILAHRGPDGANIWSEGPIGLGHRMLWTTPESLLEKLPLVKQLGDLAITADARIDNRSELIAALDFTDCASEKITDSQLILAAYEKWGDRCPEQLLGDFAFAIWDGRKQVLFCARDHFGVKPFYYYSSSGINVFATEIKALLSLPEIPRRLNEVKVADHLTSLCDDPSITFYKDILRLPPAHTITVSHEGTQLQSYWSLDPSRELRLGSNEEYAEAFRELFTEAVRCRLRSAFPIGSMLSGGLDSSSVTCMARLLLAQEDQLPTFSAIFDEVTECDERSFQNAVLTQGGFEPHRLHADQISPLTDLNRVLWHLDEAIYGGNLYILWCLYISAKEQNVRVLLNGFDGDNTVSHGTGYLIELARAGRWLTLAAEVIEYSRKLNRPWFGALWSWVKQYGLNPLSRFRVIRLMRRIWQMLRRILLAQPNATSNRLPWSIHLNPDFVKRIGLRERQQALQKSPLLPLTEREDHYRRLNWPLLTSMFELMDKAAGASAIELRFPFWDKRLVEFCLALPPEQKMHQGWTRLVMRRAMTGVLPEEVQWRKQKANFTASFDRGLLTFERERLEEVILKNSKVIEKYVDITDLREVYQQFLSQEATESDVVGMWRAVSLSLWLQHMGLTP